MGGQDPDAEDLDMEADMRDLFTQMQTTSASNKTEPTDGDLDAVNQEHAKADAALAKATKEELDKGFTMDVDACGVSGPLHGIILWSKLGEETIEKIIKAISGAVDDVGTASWRSDVDQLRVIDVRKIKFPTETAGQFDTCVSNVLANVHLSHLIMNNYTRVGKQAAMFKMQLGYKEGGDALLKKFGEEPPTLLTLAMNCANRVRGSGILMRRIRTALASKYGIFDRQLVQATVDVTEAKMLFSSLLGDAYWGEMLEQRGQVWDGKTPENTEEELCPASRAGETDMSL